jgi:signal peptidase I
MKLPKHNETSTFFLEMLETFLTSFIVLMVIYWTLAVPEVVVGASMEPTFYTGDRILVEKITKYFKKFERGDIVVLHPPGNDNTDYVKRIVAVPGDIAKVTECNVYISRDGERFKLNEPYLYSGTCTTDGPSIREGHSIRIESGKYLVLGDNRGKSLDSRVFGLVDENRIMGRVVFRFWPFDKVELY